MKILRYLLLPIVPIYYGITWLRNKLYDLGIKKSKSYSVPIICVGNLSVGGTGKTPMVEYLIKLLKEENSLATLSRGYKRKSEGFQLADNNATAETLGDEPFQFYNKFKNKILVAVDADRQNGIEQLLGLNTPPNIIILDDAFQHRKVKAGFNIMLTTFDNPFFRDMVLPTGDLREPKLGAKRANIIIVTKSPRDLDETTKAEYLRQINPKAEQYVFFSYISYSEAVISKNRTLKLTELDDFTLVTGIANATPLVKFLEERELKFEHLNFTDHYNFSRNDIDNLSAKRLIVTTEKDFMRLKSYEIISDKLYYLPIQATIGDELKFKTIIRNYLNN